MTNDGIDFKEIEALFTVIEKCVAHSGKHVGIMSAAASRLQQIDEDLREAQAEARAEAEAEAAKAAEAARPKAIPSASMEDEDTAPVLGKSHTAAPIRRT